MCSVCAGNYNKHQVAFNKPIFNLHLYCNPLLHIGSYRSRRSLHYNADDNCCVVCVVAVQIMYDRWCQVHNSNCTNIESTESLQRSSYAFYRLPLKQNLDSSGTTNYKNYKSQFCIKTIIA